MLALGAAAVICLASPTTIDRTLAKSVALGLGALAAGSAPAAIGATGWIRVGVLDVAVALLIGLATAQSGDPDGNPQPALVITAGLGTVMLAVSATAIAASPGLLVIECAVLGLMFALAAAFARNLQATVISTGAALAAATGLAFAACAAAGIRIDQAGFAALVVAVLAIVGSTLLRRTRPVHALVLDLGGVRS